MFHKVEVRRWNGTALTSYKECYWIIGDANLNTKTRKKVLRSLKKVSDRQGKSIISSPIEVFIWQPKGMLRATNDEVTLVHIGSDYWREIGMQVSRHCECTMSNLSRLTNQGLFFAHHLAYSLDLQRAAAPYFDSCMLASIKTDRLVNELHDDTAKQEAETNRDSYIESVLQHYVEPLAKLIVMQCTIKRENQMITHAGEGAKYDFLQAESTRLDHLKVQQLRDDLYHL